MRLCSLTKIKCKPLIPGCSAPLTSPVTKVLIVWFPSFAMLGAVASKAPVDSPFTVFQGRLLPEEVFNLPFTLVLNQDARTLSDP